VNLLSNELRPPSIVGCYQDPEIVTDYAFTATIPLRQQTSDQSRCDGCYLAPKGVSKGYHPLQTRSGREMLWKLPDGIFGGSGLHSSMLQLLAPQTTLVFSSI
jgi:hypothetical protein